MRRIRLNMGLLTALIATSGCSLLHEWGVPGFEAYVKDPTAQSAEGYRQRLQETGDPEALDWLLANRVRTGQSVAEINHALGDSGERVAHDRDLKSHANHYLQTDVGYKWGPDADGRSVVLFFRDGKLVQFDPGEFRR